METRAIVMRRTGPPEVLQLERRKLSPLGPGEIRLRALASAINHSDLEIRAGNWVIRRQPPFPYVPGLEVVGEVIEVAADVSAFKKGDRAWTTMQGFGGVRAERDGGYAEHVTVNEGVLASLPKTVNPVEFAAIGLAGVTALEGFRRIGSLGGKAVLVSGSRGGVGSLAMQIGIALGAHVIGLDRDTPTPEPNSVDAVLDTVAGPLFPALVSALRPEGRYCIVGAVAGGEVRFDAWTLLDGRSLTGYSTEDLNGEALRRGTRELIALKLAAPPTTVLPLEEAARGHDLLERRAVKGRVVLVP